MTEPGRAWIIMIEIHYGLNTESGKEEEVINKSLILIYIITIFVNLGLFRHFETVSTIRTWIKSHKYWRML